MRLPVILVQNAPAAGAALAEDLVGHLIGRAGLDLTLVDRFDSLAPNSTDRMTLDGITVPAAVLDWQTESELIAALSAIEFLGTRAAHQLDPNPSTEPGPSRRRLFLFDLNRTTDASAIIAALDRIRESLSVKTFSLGGIAGPASASPSGNGSTEKRNGTSRPAQIVNEQAPPKTNAPAPPPGTMRSDENLDALIDQLDDVDV